MAKKTADSYRPLLLQTALGKNDCAPIMSSPSALFCLPSFRLVALLSVVPACILPHYSAVLFLRKGYHARLKIFEDGLRLLRVASDWNQFIVSNALYPHDVLASNSNH